ncbi:hypothetical protein HG536_0B00460 [Torulaspora globosa]|uniref:ER membrane protein complex subunit 1 n=1 Tax=Torulaspora globosa TaxID=48254 RepID=A0A7G3ZCE9_9SACH|nr:uncharacterized protein HG536_0B00460 [Torulaspora globosa]QLL31185.1 hypothetical protein HG536_0B00460 [Torulaspora globosa]
MRSLLIALLGFWLEIAAVRAIFIEDAFETDWQLQNIGIYNCVLKNQEQGSFIVLSDFGSKTLLSYVNETDGQLLSRHVLDLQATDAMMTADRKHIVLKTVENEFMAFDSYSGLLKNDLDFPASEFRSGCKPDLSNIKLIDGTVQVLDSETGLLIFESDLPPKFESIAFIETDYVSELQLLVHTTDDEYFFQLMKNNTMERSWIRDESNHDIVAHTFIDIGDSNLDVVSEEILKENSFPNAWQAYVFRVTTNWNRLRDSFRESGYSVGKFLTKLFKLDSASLTAGQDANLIGVKYLVVATKYGVIQALDIQDGKKIWNFDSGLKNILLVEYISDSHELLVFAEEGSYFIYRIEDGKVPVLREERSVGQKSVKSVSLLDSRELFIEFLDGEKKVVTFKRGSDHPRTFICNHDSKGVYGHAIDANQSLEDTWIIKFPEFEDLAAFAGRKEAPIVTLGQTLGNRTVLYKYLYPNMASYITVNKQTSTMYVNLIDTITGELLYSQMHEDKIDADQPINMVFGEYWFVYSYFSTEPVPEQKLVTVELYESLEANERISTDSEQINPLRSHHKPAVISKAYFFPEIIQRMSLSQTIFGITSKTIILELKNGQITFLSKDILSARRVEESKMTNDDKKEFMAMPYISMIPLNDHFVISHSRTLLLGDNAKLVSTATNLESTSVVCDIGHDIFCSKIYPSGQFDIMSPSFEKGKLIATIAILVIVCYFLRPSVEAAKLKRSWLVR